jgi:predicted alpha-1,2-mannosidase
MALAAVALLLIAATPAPRDPVRLIDPLIGVDWYGEVFIGATTPFGMVKLGPDMESFDGVDSKSGYLSAGRIVGFSHLHLSGAAGKYGNIRVMPASGEVDMADLATPRSDEVVEPAYYAATLTRPHVRAEMTATPRAGLHRYTFQSGADAHLTVRIDKMLNNRGGREDQRFLGGDLHIVSSHEVDGTGRYQGGWNLGDEYRVYFALVTDRDAMTARSWLGGAPSSQPDIAVDGDHPIGAILDFGARAGQVVNAKVGISFVSVDQARRNAEAAGNFDAVHAQAVGQWRQALSPVTIEGGSEAERRQLYTALYHIMMMPVDRTGENPKWQSSEPYYDDYYALWDTFRTSYPLLALIAPDRHRDLIRSLIDIYRHEGWLPDARSGNSTGRTQGGSNADVVIADAYVKGVTGIDYKTGLEAMLKNATISPPDDEKEGRGGLPDYLTKGYISTSFPRAGSRTMEYAYDDFAIAQLACGLGKADVARAYAKQSGNWAHLWDSTLTQEGVSGFLRPRNPDGSWAAPDLTKRGTWPNFMYEGDIWTYSLYAPQDVAGLIALSGGRDAFVKRLDTLFDHLHFDMTNEPGFLIPMLYHWAGRPDKSADRIVDYREKAFIDGRGGIPGNDDSGAMSSWLTFQMIGLFPVAGQDVYLIGAPVFPRVSLALGNGHKLVIQAEGLGDSSVNRYVQSAELNGRPLNRSWFRHADIAQGGVLTLHMGSAPTAWGRMTPPPSLSDNPICKG